MGESIGEAAPEGFEGAAGEAGEPEGAEEELEGEEKEGEEEACFDIQAAVEGEAVAVEEGGEDDGLEDVMGEGEASGGGQVAEEGVTGSGEERVAQKTEINEGTGRPAEDKGEGAKDGNTGGEELGGMKAGPDIKALAEEGDGQTIKEPPLVEGCMSAQVREPAFAPENDTEEHHGGHHRKEEDEAGKGAGIFGETHSDDLREGAVGIDKEGFGGRPEQLGFLSSQDGSDFGSGFRMRLAKGEEPGEGGGGEDGDAGEAARPVEERPAAPLPKEEDEAAKDGVDEEDVPIPEEGDVENAEEREDAEATGIAAPTGNPGGTGAFEKEVQTDPEEEGEEDVKGALEEKADEPVGEEVEGVLKKGSPGQQGAERGRHVGNVDDENPEQSKTAQDIEKLDSVGWCRGRERGSHERRQPPPSRMRFTFA